MGWLDRFRRGEDSATGKPETEEEVAEDLEEEAHEARDDLATEEPRPPGG
jgi:hypothetical protein